MGRSLRLVLVVARAKEGKNKSVIMIAERLRFAWRRLHKIPSDDHQQSQCLLVEERQTRSYNRCRVEMEVESIHAPNFGK